jgi:hypothetical protein
MFHRCIAVLLIAVSLFLHAAPTAMAVGIDMPSEAAPETATAPSNGEKWDFSPANKFIQGIENSKYLSKLVCTLPVIPDLFTRAAEIFGTLNQVLSIFGVSVTDPSNTMANIQQVMLLTQQLKSMYDQCKNQQTIASILGSNALPVGLSQNMAYTLGVTGEQSFRKFVIGENPWLYGKMSLNSPEDVARAGFDALNKVLDTIEFVAGVVGDISGDKQAAEDIAGFKEKAKKLGEFTVASVGIFTNAWNIVGGEGSVFQKGQALYPLYPKGVELAGTLSSIVGPLKKPGDENSPDADDCAGIDNQDERMTCLYNANAYNVALVNQVVGGGLPADEQPMSGKIKTHKGKFRDKALSGAAAPTGGPTTPLQMAKVLAEPFFGGRGSWSTRECEATVIANRQQAAQKCALACAAVSMNYINDSASRVQNLVLGDPKAPCVVGGKTVSKNVCTTITDLATSCNNMRCDFQLATAVTFHQLTRDMLLGDLIAVCAACDGIRGLQGTPTRCE